MSPTAVHSMKGAKDPPSKLDFTTFHNVINGKLVPTKKTRHGINPATLEALPEVPVSTPEDVDAAMDAGKAAFKLWRNTPWNERSKAVNAFAEALLEHKAEFAKLLTKEQGKPIPMAENEVDTAYTFLTTFASLQLQEEVMAEDDKKQTIVRYTPLGIVVGIVPWNFPIMLACGKLAPALLTGNSIVIKPSPFTPYCDMKLVELGQRFFPAGVLQILSGDDELGPWLTAHPAPAKISFTGSSATGKKVMESAAKTLKRVTLELGGKDPAIICSDVDIASVAPQIATMAFLNSGQVCLAIKRIYVHAAIYDEFRDAVAAHTRKLVLGNGEAAGVFMGPVQNKMQYEKVSEFFSDVEARKMKIVAGGEAPPADPAKQGGYYIKPTIIDAPPDNSRIAMEEPFGPIVPMMKWDSEEDVIARANDTQMGLGASVWSKDLDQAARIARQLEAGSVWVNTHLEVDPMAPFGGHKESGVGFEFGLGGLKQFCNTQALYMKKKA
ncbi:uncharacterized protein K452DRAFT_318982 [Aplosporella prunicola CBS 121167]|uniref:aldehyde dehydrogenase (NAD(+)) n=1 Tax=Aplosporella prunicola CBS 121167 TaxID=1176127 RepID=A0A6A6BDH8_9PEZI|nr:uncharacterized protein K452DRAFT_318982 [Aplosporella prunicola CBS 121167]KAF2141345.1 hypothetical protein K452DRAFT_318982 [Aplosporella prunicola CBS 121167]